MKTLTILTILLFVLPAFAEDAEPNEKLCSIKTVYIEGEPKKTNGYRKNIEKKTWLKIENVKQQADAIFKVEKDNSISITRQYPEEFIWQADTGNFLWSGCSGFNLTTTGCMLKKLNKDANCPKESSKP